MMNQYLSKHAYQKQRAIEMVIAPILILISTIPSFSQTKSPFDPNLDQPDARCGAQCLFIALDALDRSPGEYSVFESRLGPPEANGYSLARLREHAQAAGIKTLAVETSLENLAARREPFACITLIRGNHFILLYDVTPTRVAIAEADRTYELSRSSFESIWNRSALLLSRSPLEPEESVSRRRWLAQVLPIAGFSLFILLVVGLLAWLIRKRFRAADPAMFGIAAGFVLLAGCSTKSAPDPRQATSSPSSVSSIQIVPPVHDLGTVFRAQVGQKIPLVTRIQNSTRKPVRILNVVSGCDCTEVEFDRSILPPGASAKLRASLSLGDSNDPRVARIRVLMDAPQSPESTIEIHWQVQNPLTIQPDRMENHALALGESQAAEAGVVLKGMGLCAHCVVEAHAGDGPARVSLAPPITLPRPGHDTSSGDPVALGKMAIQIPASTEELAFDQSPRVEIWCAGKIRARALFPMRWSAAAPLGVLPQRLSLGVTTAGFACERTVQLAARDGRLFRILSVRCEGDGSWLQPILPQDADRLQEVRLQITAPMQAGPWRRSIEIQTDHPERPSIAIPISGLIQTASTEPIRGPEQE